MAIYPTRMYGSEWGTRADFCPELAFARYFDVDTKLWKPLASVAQLDERIDVCCYAELIGSYLFVVTGVQMQHRKDRDYVVYRYHILNNKWEKLPKLK